MPLIGCDVDVDVDKGWYGSGPDPALTPGEPIPPATIVAAGVFGDCTTT